MPRLPHNLPATGDRVKLRGEHGTGYLTGKLSAAVNEFLRSQDVRETEGPYYSHFMVKRDDGLSHKIVYHTYYLGVTKPGIPYENRTNIAGRFETYEALEAVVQELLARKTAAARFLVWRSKPEVERENGRYFKAYLRFAVTDCERWFNDAKRLHIEDTPRNATQSPSHLNADGI